MKRSPGRVDRQVAVERALHNQAPDAAGADLDDVTAEVFEPGRHNLPCGAQRSAGGDVPAHGHHFRAHAGAEVLVEVVEVFVERRVERVGVRLRAGDDPVEDLLRNTRGVVVREEEERLERGEERDLREAVGAVGGGVTPHLTGAHGESDEEHIVQVEGVEHHVEVGGERVVVVPLAGLAGLAEPAAVVRDDPVPGLEQCAGLRGPGCSAERVPVDQHHRLAGSVVFVVEVDVGAVFGADCDD